MSVTILSNSRRSGKVFPSTEYRSDYEGDYDRLIFSSQFRRLQNKTQVFPLPQPGSVFVHNRLTHSLEVSSVGRSLGRRIGHTLCDMCTSENFDMGVVVAAACLAHDIGNPPFGHSGEKAIGAYFDKNWKDLAKGYEIDDKYKKEFVDFEGNASGFRILTYGRPNRNAFGFDLTASTLAASVKYPCCSQCVNKDYASRKKYAIFSSEASILDWVAGETAMLKCTDGGYKRYFLSFLVEAADDICNSIIDIEDAHRLKVLTYEEIWEKLKPLWDGEYLIEIEDRLKSFGDDNQERIAYLRARYINHYTETFAKMFEDNIDDIISDEFDTQLENILPENDKKVFEDMKGLAKSKVYTYPPILHIEIAGYKVLGGLLEEFVPAVLAKDPNSYQKKIVALLPNQHHILTGDNYSKLLGIVDFVSGMTDSFALELHRKLTGVTIPMY